VLTIIFGPPGTGKTTADLSVIEREVTTGTPLDRIAYVTFMRSAAADAFDRLGVDEEGRRFLWFRTLHSTCFRLLGMSRENVVTPEWLKKFGDHVGLEMSKGDGERDIEEVADAILFIRSAGSKSHLKSQGSYYRSMYNLSRLMCRTGPGLDAVRLAPHPGALDRLITADYSPGAYTGFVERYELEKERDGKKDFADMLEGILRAPPVASPWEVAVIDEAQDMSPLQFAVCERLFFACRLTILSGDDDQAVMGFQGSSARDFLSYRDRATIVNLRQTHRFGDAIVNFAQRVADRIGERHPKEILGVPGRDNDIREVYRFDPASVMSGDMILHRHVAGCNEIARRLVGAGVPFWNERGMNPLARTAEIEAYVAWRNLSEGMSLTADQIHSLATRTPSVLKEGGESIRLVRHGAKKVIGEMAPAMVIPPEKFDSFFGQRFLEAAAKKDPCFLDAPFASYYDLLIRKGFNPAKDRAKVTCTTIHGSKGREAGRVWLCSETYPKAMLGGDDEHRVAYVGATRTKGDLLLVREPLVGDWTDRYPYPVEV